MTTDSSSDSSPDTATDTVTVAAVVRLLPAPREVAPTPDELARLDGSLATLLRRETAAVRRGERRRRLGAPMVIAASAVAIAGWAALGLGNGDPGRQLQARPVVASPQAVEVLHRASRAALSDGADTTVGADQLVYTRSMVISNEGTLGSPPELGAAHERERWASQDPGGVEQVGLLREFGQDWPMGAGAPTWPGVVRPTYAWLETLPSDPDALLAEIEDDVARHGGEVDPDQEVFNRIGDLVREGLVPPRTTAALYEAVTRIPGVTIDPEATDAIGRTGVGIGREDDVFGMRSVWIFDPSTYEVLGTRDYFVTPDADVLANATAVLERAVVDDLGEEPARPTA